MFLTRLTHLTHFTILASLLTKPTSALTTSVLASYFPCIPHPPPLSPSSFSSSSSPPTQLCILHSTTPSTPPTIDPTLPITITPITANISVYSPLCVLWGSGVVAGYEREATVWAMGLSFSEPLRVEMVQGRSQTQVKGKRKGQARAQIQVQAVGVDGDADAVDSAVDKSGGKTTANGVGNGTEKDEWKCMRINTGNDTANGIGQDAPSIAHEAKHPLDTSSKRTIKYTTRQHPNPNPNLNRAGPGSSWQGASPRWTYQGRKGGIENCICKSGWGGGATGYNAQHSTRNNGDAGEELSGRGLSRSGNKRNMMSAGESQRVDNCACTFECVPFRQ